MIVNGINDFSHQINTAKGILDTILSVQPKQGGSQGGETRESVVYHLADDMLKKLPKQYKDFEVNGRRSCSTRQYIRIRVFLDDFRSSAPFLSFAQVKESLQRMGALLPMNIFLRQEIDRIKKVIGVVQKTLCDLKLAIDGTIVMSQGLRESLDAMYDARIPLKWQKVGETSRRHVCTSNRAGRDFEIPILF